jgi:hypothetical protein
MKLFEHPDFDQAVLRAAEYSLRRLRLLPVGKTGTLF